MYATEDGEIARQRRSFGGAHLALAARATLHDAEVRNDRRLRSGSCERERARKLVDRSEKSTSTPLVHEHVSMHTHAQPLRIAAQPVEIGGAVVVREEAGRAVDAALDDVQGKACERDARAAGHGHAGSFEPRNE